MRRRESRAGMGSRAMSCTQAGRRGARAYVGLAAGGLLIAAMAGNSTLSAQAATGQNWTLIKSIPVGSEPTLAPDVSVVTNPITNTVYASSFSVPVSGDFPQPGASEIWTIDGSSNTVEKEIDLGDPTLGEPDQMAVDTANDKLYVPLESGSVQVLDGATDSLGADIAMPPGSEPYGAAVDSATHAVYIVDGASEDGDQGGYYVLDGSNDTITTTVSGLDDDLESPALDTTQGKLFIPVQGDDYVVVASTQGSNENQIIGGIYGTSDELASPISIAVDESTNRAYVANYDTGTVAVIDTVSDTLIGAPITVAGVASLNRVAVDPATHTVFVVSQPTTGPGQLSVIDETSDAVISTVSVPSASIRGLAVNPATDTVYVGGSEGDTGYVWAYQLQNAPTPPGPNPNPITPASATGEATLADTGVNLSVPTMIVGFGLLVSGIAVLLVRGRRSCRARHSAAAQIK